MLSWRQTVNRLEDQAAGRSGTIIILDESHMIDARQLDAAVYMLMGGNAKGRLNRDLSAKETPNCRVSLLSSGERSVETHLLRPISITTPVRVSGSVISRLAAGTGSSMIFTASPPARRFQIHCVKLLRCIMAPQGRRSLSV
jgi:hypothetical protein